MMYLCICASLVKFQHLVKEIMYTQTFYCITKVTILSIYSVVTLEIRSRSSKSNHFFALFLWCICASSVYFQPLVKEILCTLTFYFINMAPFCVFIMWWPWRSPKSNHFFPPSWWCICVSLVKFQPLVKDIMCTQTFYCINKVHFFEYL